MIKLCISIRQNSECGFYPTSVGQEVKQIQEILARMFIIVQVYIATFLDLSYQVAYARI